MFRTLLPILTNSLLAVCLCTLLYSEAQAKAPQSNYESFLKDKNFKAQDDKLNSLFKNIMNSISPAQKAALLNEQRFWNKEIFSKEFDAEKKDKGELQAAVDSVEYRNSELEKLLNSKQGKPFGLAIKWGMTPNKVCEALEIQNTDVCRNINQPDYINDYPYKKKLLGQDADIRFTFLNTIFYTVKSDLENKENKSDFSDFVKKINKIFAVELGTKNEACTYLGEQAIRTQTQPLQILCAVSTSMGTEDGYSVLKDNMPKKYKSVYITDENLLNSLDADRLVSNISWYPETKLFEDKNTYIYLLNDSGLGAAGVFAFIIGYEDKDYILLNIPDKKALAKKLQNFSAYNSSFSILPESSDLRSIIYAFGGRSIMYSRLDPGYYELTVQYGDGDDTIEIELLLNNKDQLFAFRIRYDQKPSSLINEGTLLPKISKKYKEIKENDPICEFNEYSNSNDSIFESKENFISFYLNPYDGDTYFMVANKEKLAEQIKFIKKEHERIKQKSEKNKEELKKTLGDF